MKYKLYLAFAYNYIMNQKSILTAPKTNESSSYGVGYKPFVVGALYVSKMNKQPDCFKSTDMTYTQELKKTE